MESDQEILSNVRPSRTDARLLKEQEPSCQWFHLKLEYEKQLVVILVTKSIKNNIMCLFSNYIKLGAYSEN